MLKSNSDFSGLTFVPMDKRTHGRSLAQVVAAATSYDAQKAVDSQALTQPHENYASPKANAAGNAAAPAAITPLYSDSPLKTGQKTQSAPAVMTTSTIPATPATPALDSKELRLG